jgi:hypothetical protein
LAFLKDGNDRNNNMQYLECLSASLQDMAHTYQPAERMFLVLQAVLAELRGTPLDHRGGFVRPVIPARRGSSTMDSVEFPSFTKRRNIKRANSRHSVHERPTSMSLDLNIDPMLASLGPHRHRKASDNDPERPESFVLVTPRSEVCSWNALTEPTSGLDRATIPSTADNVARADSGSTWMGAELEVQDMSVLASVHFPELRDIPEMGSENGNGLDFLSFNHGDEWKDWRPSGEAGLTSADLETNGFPLSNGFGAGYPGTPSRLMDVSLGRD